MSVKARDVATLDCNISGPQNTDQTNRKEFYRF